MNMLKNARLKLEHVESNSGSVTYCRLTEFLVDNQDYFNEYGNDVDSPLETAINFLIALEKGGTWRVDTGNGSYTDVSLA